MSSLSTKSVLDALNWRYATKIFDPEKKIPAEIWDVLEQSLLLAPSSFGLQPWRFLVVQDRELRKKLCTVSWGQTQPLDCSHYVVFLGRKNLDAAYVDRFLAHTAQVRNVPIETLQGYRDIIIGSVTAAHADGRLDIWQSRQVYIALGEFMTTAALVGVDTCPMEGFEPAKYDEILGVDTTQWSTLCSCAAGYRSPSDKYAALAKIRFPKQDIISYL